MEIRECPFCGGEAHISERIGYGGKMYGVSCSTPLCPGHDLYIWAFRPEDVIKAWNTRSERTCTVDAMCFNDATSHYEYWLSCGDSFEWIDDTPPDYCMYCGAKVVDDGDR